jgi:hypothetical protein
MHTLGEASLIAKVPEAELLGAIREGLLRAEVFQNTGLYHVEAEELRRYMRHTRRQDVSSMTYRRKVLILDDDVCYADSLRLELGRDARLEVRSATWSRDGVTAVRTLSPHLCLLGWKAPDVLVEEVVGILSAPEKRLRTRTLIYASNTLLALAGDDPLKNRVEALGSGAWVSKAQGMRTLVVRVYALLALETKTQLIQRR